MRRLWISSSWQSGLATPELITRVAGLVGSTPGQARTGLGAAVPAVLAGILGADSRPGAAAALDLALSRAGEIGGLLERDPALAAGAGSEVLAPVLGGGAVGPFETALGGFAGLPKAAAGTLIGLAGAMVLGALDKTAADGPLDAAGALVRIRADKDAIAAAIPPGLARAIGATGLLAGLGAPKAKPGTEEARNPSVRPPIDLLQPAPPPPPPSGRATPVKWAAVLILIAAVVWFGLHLFGPAPETAEVAPAGTVAATADPLMAGSVDVGAKMQAALDQILAAFAEITDANSARIALPKLAAANASLAALQDPVNSLREDGHIALKSIIEARLPSIDQGADRLLTDPNLAPEVKPIISDILAELTAFSA